MAQKMLNDEGCWKEVEIPKDENIIELSIGEEFVGLFAGSKPNPSFDGELIHVFETDNGNMRMMYGKTNLDRWMKNVSPGSMVKISRLEDRKVGQPKPLHMFKVWIWEEN